jgi:hypothetical protein
VASIALPLIGAALGGVGGFFGGQPQTTKSNFSNSGTYSTSGGQSTNLTDEQANALPQLGQYIQTRLEDPSAGLAPIKAAAVSNLNAGYSALPTQLRNSMRNTGGGAGGNFGTSMRLAALQRLHDMGMLDSNFAQMILGAQDTGANAAQALLARTFGTSTRGGGQSTQSGSSTTTGPDTSTAGAFGGGLGGLLAGFKLGKP